MSVCAWACVRPVCEVCVSVYAWACVRPVCEVCVCVCVRVRAVWVCVCSVCVGAVCVCVIMCVSADVLNDLLDVVIVDESQQEEHSTFRWVAS